VPAVRKAILLILVMLIPAVLFGGPVASGGIFLLLPIRNAPAPVPLPTDYQPLHKGSVDLASGLYTRVNEDLVVPGAPGLVLRRTYLSGYRAPKQFGIGTTHNGEEFIVGDGERFQWVSLILATGARINFKRTSPGTSLLNAMFVHEEAGTDWQGARLGWTGMNWAARKQDGSLSTYQGCGEGTICSIIRSRDAAGQTIHYRRDSGGRLLKMDDGGDRWIAFDYDSQSRIKRAYSSGKQEVVYDYDPRGRLDRVSYGGNSRRYGYSDNDELATIEEPGTSIENTYANGRCVRQVNRYPDREAFTFIFAYHVEGERIVRTDTTQSDGSWTKYTWGADRYATSETHGRTGVAPAEFIFDRDPVSKAVTAFTVTCPDRTGRPLRHSAVVRPGREQEVRENLLATHCYWRLPAASQVVEQR
jgi:hypothetical protein